MDLIRRKEQMLSTIDFIYKSALGFIDGGHIVTEIIDFGAKVHRDRLTKFSEMLMYAFEDVSGKFFDPEHLKTEHFIDVFEAVIKKVYSTSSYEKLKRYRNVLIREMYERNDSEIFFKYLNLIDDVSETQILILSGLNQHTEQTELEICKYLANPDQYPAFLLDKVNNDSFQIYNKQFMLFSDISFFINDLIKNGIIIINANPLGINYMSESSIPQADRHTLTPIGKGFLKFIEEYDAEN